MSQAGEAAGRLFIPVVLGSIRERRRSSNATRLILSRVEEAGHESELIDLRELDMPMYDEAPESEGHPGVARFRQTLDRADAVIWHSPEYNHSFTSVIKNAIDFLDEEIRRKPSAVCGLGGLSGGIRAVEQLKQVLIELHSVPIRDSVHFTDARNVFSPEGELLKPEFVPRIDLMVRELEWYARALNWGRAHVPLPARR
ncbi:MAG TPA: NADPH-dependent FMN reductase [Chloroflexota bacterium]|nr:NADPH-dependent FMN reductase [Chloroflexota bacterium]